MLLSRRYESDEEGNFCGTFCLLPIDLLTYSVSQKSSPIYRMKNVFAIRQIRSRRKIRPTIRISAWDREPCVSLDGLSTRERPIAHSYRVSLLITSSTSCSRWRRPYPCRKSCILSRSAPDPVRICRLADTRPISTDSGRVWDNRRRRRRTRPPLDDPERVDGNHPRVSPPVALRGRTGDTWRRRAPNPLDPAGSWDTRVVVPPGSRALDPWSWWSCCVAAGSSNTASRLRCDWCRFSESAWRRSDLPSSPQDFAPKPRPSRHNTPRRTRASWSDGAPSRWHDERNSCWFARSADKCCSDTPRVSSARSGYLARNRDSRHVDDGSPSFHDLFVESEDRFWSRRRWFRKHRDAPLPSRRPNDESATDRAIAWSCPRFCRSCWSSRRRCRSNPTACDARRARTTASRCWRKSRLADRRGRDRADRAHSDKRLPVKACSPFLDSRGPPSAKPYTTVLARNPDSSRPAAYPSSRVRSRPRSTIRRLPRRRKTRRPRVDRDSETNLRFFSSFFFEIFFPYDFNY